MDEQYFREQIFPLLDQPGIEFPGRNQRTSESGISGSNLWAALFQIDWPEPFGLVMIEAMACGTVLAFNRGSVSEIVEDGKTGIVVQSKDEAIRDYPTFWLWTVGKCGASSSGVFGSTNGR